MTIPVPGKHADPPTTDWEPMNTPDVAPVDPDPAQFGFTQEVVVDARPDTVYDLISDVVNIGRWSPTADQVAYDLGDGPTAGSWFHGRNERNGKRWETRSQVEVADRPATFCFVVGGVRDGIVRWCWRFSPAGDDRTTVALSWSLLRLDPVLGTSAAEILELQRFMHDSVATTLAGLAHYLRSD